METSSPQLQIKALQELKKALQNNWEIDPSDSWVWVNLKVNGATKKYIGISKKEMLFRVNQWEGTNEQELRVFGDFETIFKETKGLIPTVEVEGFVNG